MSYLADEITRQMRLSGIKTNKELADRSRIDPATISRWINGTQTSVNDEDLENLANALSTKEADHAALIAARMRDVGRGPGASLVSVHIGTEALREVPPEYGTKKLPPRGRRAFEILANHYMESADLRDMLDSLANIFQPDNEVVHVSAAPTPAKRPKAKPPVEGRE